MKKREKAKFLAAIRSVREDLKLTPKYKIYGYFTCPKVLSKALKGSPSPRVQWAKLDNWLISLSPRFIKSVLMPTKAAGSDKTYGELLSQVMGHRSMTPSPVFVSDIVGLTGQKNVAERFLQIRLLWLDFLEQHVEGIEVEPTLLQRWLSRLMSVWSRGTGKQPERPAYHDSVVNALLSSIGEERTKNYLQNASTNGARSESELLGGYYFIESYRLEGSPNFRGYGLKCINSYVYPVKSFGDSKLEADKFVAEFSASQIPEVQGAVELDRMKVPDMEVFKRMCGPLLQGAMAYETPTCAFFLGRCKALKYDEGEVVSYFFPTNRIGKALSQHFVRKLD